MNKVLVDFKGSPDGMHVIQFKEGDDFTYDGDLLAVAQKNKWVGSPKKTKAELDAEKAAAEKLTAENKAKALAEEAAKAKTAKINDLIADKVVLNKELEAAEEAGKADIQAEIDVIDTQIKDLEAE